MQREQALTCCFHLSRDHGCSERARSRTGDARHRQFHFAARPAALPICSGTLRRRAASLLHSIADLSGCGNRSPQRQCLPRQRHGDHHCDVGSPFDRALSGDSIELSDPARRSRGAWRAARFLPDGKVAVRPTGAAFGGRPACGVQLRDLFCRRTPQPADDCDRAVWRGAEPRRDRDRQLAEAGRTRPRRSRDRLTGCRLLRRPAGRMGGVPCGCGARGEDRLPAQAARGIADRTGGADAPVGE